MTKACCNIPPVGYGPPVTLVALDGVHKYVRLPVPQYDQPVIQHDGMSFQLTREVTVGGWRVYREVKA